MKPATIALFVGLLACAGCSDSQNMVQINNSNMKVSSNPLDLTQPVVFENQLSPKRTLAIKEAFGARNGVGYLPVSTNKENQISLAEYPILSSRITRRIEVKQGEKLLYDEEVDVTQENLKQHSTVYVSSDQWKIKPDSSISEGVFFSVQYYLHATTEKGNWTWCVVGDSAMIPAAKK